MCIRDSAGAEHVRTLALPEDAHCLDGSPTGMFTHIARGVQSQSLRSRGVVEETHDRAVLRAGDDAEESVRLRPGRRRDDANGVNLSPARVGRWSVEEQHTK